MTGTDSKRYGDGKEHQADSMLGIAHEQLWHRRDLRFPAQKDDLKPEAISVVSQHAGHVRERSSGREGRDQKGDDTILRIDVQVGRTVRLDETIS